MISIYLNDQPVQVKRDHSLAEFLTAQGYRENGASVAVNRSFVPRAQHPVTFLQEGDRVHVVSPMQGG